MKLMLIASIMIASSSLAGLNYIANVDKVNKVVSGHENFGVSQEQCFIVREWQKCVKYSADGICCISVINK